MPSPVVPTRLRWLAVGLVGASIATAGCSAPASESAQVAPRTWDQVLVEADGQTVDLWMYGGDDRGNAYVDDVLAPAAADLGVTLRRVPITDTREALQRMLAERAAGTDDGTVDLVWVNGDNFATGKQADAWLCGWSEDLPNMAGVASDDPLVSADFGVDVDGCEAPWHKAQFTFVYDAERVPDPPSSLSGLLDWAEDHPGRFTYPAPPDFTGSVFVREALYSVAGGAEQVPATYDQGAFDSWHRSLGQVGRGRAVPVASGSHLPEGLRRARQPLRRRSGRLHDDLRSRHADRSRGRRHLPRPARGC